MRSPPYKRFRSDLHEEEDEDEDAGVVIECTKCGEEYSMPRPQLADKWMCWPCAVDHELEDDFIAPETDKEMEEYVRRAVELQGEDAGEDDGEGDLSPPIVTVPFTFPKKSPEESKIVIDLTADDDHDAVDAVCTAEMVKFLGNDSLRYGSHGIMASARSELPPSLDWCDCASRDSMCKDDSCLNRLTHTECNPSNCLYGERNCGNRPITFKEGVELALIQRKDVGGGFGCKTVHPLKEGDYVAEYVGDVLSYQQMRVTQAMDILHGQVCFYTMHLSGRGEAATYIDARHTGNLTRFINHSASAPNIKCWKWDANGYARRIFLAARDIAAGEELFFDYGTRGIEGKIPVTHYA